MRHLAAHHGPPGGGLVLAAGEAIGGDGALQAKRIARRANRCAQFHDGLVEISGPAGSTSARPALRSGAGAERHAGAAAAFQPSMRQSTRSTLPSTTATAFTVSDAGDGRGRVCADAGQRPQLLGVVGQVALCCEGHELRRLVQHARAAIVAEAAPQSQDLLLSRFGQRNKLGKRSQERLVALDHDRNPSLLEHDFRDPDGAGIGRATPGQIALVQFIPGQQRDAAGPVRRRDAIST